MNLLIGKYASNCPLLFNEKDGSVLVLVCEIDDSIPPFYIGSYCVTNRQYYSFVNETGHVPPHRPRPSAEKDGWTDGTYPDEMADHPVVCVTWEDACSYATWAGCVLPTESQWELAATGISRSLYPWGNVWEAARCRYSGNRTHDTTCRVYDYPSGVSEFGVFNMCGNVWEWCTDGVDNGNLKIDPITNRRILRGGSWFDAKELCSTKTRRLYTASSSFTTFGFRLAYCPNPLVQ